MMTHRWLGKGIQAKRGSGCSLSSLIALSLLPAMILIISAHAWSAPTLGSPAVSPTSPAQRDTASAPPSPQAARSSQESAGNPQNREGAGAGENARRPPLPIPGQGGRSWAYGISFCVGALLLAFFLSRRLFQEQFDGRRTLRFMEDKLSPYFEELGIQHLHLWVDRAAPHILYARRSGEHDQLASFSTPELLEKEGLGVAPGAPPERFIKLLGIYPLSLQHLGGDEVPPPAELELTLRVELKVTELPMEGLTETPLVPVQRQELWVLRHSGHRWCLHHCQRLAPGEGFLEAVRPEVLPPLLSWRRPGGEEDQSEQPLDSMS